MPNKLSLLRVAKGIKQDVKAGRNLDSYIAAAIGLVLAILGVIGITSLAINISALLAAVSIILLLELDRAHSLDGIQAVLRAQQSSALSILRDEDYAAQISYAKTITLVTLLNFRFLASNSETLANFLARGGHLRQLVMDVENAESIYVATKRASGASQSRDHTIGQARLTNDKIRELASSVSNGGTLDMRKCPYPTSHVITWFQFEWQPDVIYVTPSGFQQRSEARPTLTIMQDSDPVGFEFFRSYVENLWNWEDTEEVELNDGV